MTYYDMCDKQATFKFSSYHPRFKLQRQCSSAVSAVHICWYNSSAHCTAGRQSLQRFILSSGLSGQRVARPAHGCLPPGCTKHSAVPVARLAADIATDCCQRLGARLVRTFRTQRAPSCDCSWQQELCRSLLWG